MYIHVYMQCVSLDLCIYTAHNVTERSAVISLQGSIQEKMRQRETEVSRNQLLQRDVERFRNRQMFVTQIKHLRMKKCWLVREGVSEWVGG